MVRLLFLWAIGPLLSAMSATASFFETARNRLAELWPIAFPLAPPGHERSGGWSSYQDAKPVARRFREYRARVMARVVMTPAVRPVAA